MANEQLINTLKPVTICSASAGTGKTFTLSAYYVGLLLSGVDYRSILAITFTNKATAEMRERILTYLYAISVGEEKKFLARARAFMLHGNTLPDEELEQRAKTCFRKMLADFDNMHVKTIDSFLQTLLSGFAGILHTSAGTNTELDVQHVIKQSVDQLMTTDLTEENLRIIERYTQYQLSQETSWDIRGSLIALAKELYNERAQILDSENQIIYDADFISARSKRIEQQWSEHPNVKRINELLDALERTGLSFTHGGDIQKAINNIRNTLNNIKSQDKKDRFRGLTEKQLTAIEAGDWDKTVPRDALDMIVEATHLIRSSRKIYNTIQLSIAQSHNMELISSLQHIIQRNLDEANCALLARTAGILSDALEGGDADFILEKAGIRYHHVLIDEFQDTSRLQWSVIEKLLMDLIASENNTMLIVGDIKQSIYRWRNGDWHIMDDLRNEKSELSKDRLNEKFTSLVKNFRSSEEVVRFNLSLFDHIVRNYSNIIEDADAEELDLIRRIYEEGYEESKLSGFYRSDEKKGGLVCFKSFEGENNDERMEANAGEMFRTMEELLRKGMQPDNMLVLLRQGKGMFERLTKAHAALDPNEFPLLSSTPIVSERSFLLDASDAVMTVIAALKMIVNDDRIAEEQVLTFADDPDIIGRIRKRVTTKTPLYEAICELIAILLTDENGHYEGQETAYINCLLDRTREFVSAYGSNMKDYLDYWEDTLRDKSIPAMTAGAIRMMTIHKSKGLQAQTVFIPFCNWEIAKPESCLWCPMAPELDEGDDQIPVPTGDEMALSAYSEAYDDELKTARVDGLNMLYVALTRAEDNLYIYTSKTMKELHVGEWIMDFVGEDYTAGELVTEKEDDKEKIEPFAFKKVHHTDEAELWANSDHVIFKQSQEGLMYNALGEEAYRRMARMEEGSICHEIFAGIRTIHDLDSALDRAMTQGLIKSEEQRQELKELISSSWEGNEKMREWFTLPWILHIEMPVFYHGLERRPDRVMINPNTNEVIVLDYKFGGEEEEYKTQVREYMDAMREMGHPVVRGYLWYARKHKLEEVH